MSEVTHYGAHKPSTMHLHSKCFQEDVWHVLALYVIGELQVYADSGRKGTAVVLQIICALAAG
jgi:hypothetical protein